MLNLMSHFPMIPNWYNGGAMTKQKLVLMYFLLRLLLHVKIYDPSEARQHLK